MSEVPKPIHLIRTYDAEPATVWHAWTDADAISQWWHAAGASTPRESVEVDLRVGGAYRYTMVDDDTQRSVTTGGVYRSIDYCERLEFTRGHIDADPDTQPHVVVELEPARHGTRMSVEVRGVGGYAGDGSYHDGWVAVLDTLERYLVSVDA